MNSIKQFLFYLISSFSLAVIVYYILWLIMPHNSVFGSWFRMYSYHHENPLPFIFIPCFFYAVFAKLFSPKFENSNAFKRFRITALMVILIIFISSPLGGMLYFYFDMKAGYFPDNWLSIMIENGVSAGLSLGWLIVLLSFPYNVIGIIVCYLLTKKGSKLIMNL